MGKKKEAKKATYMGYEYDEPVQNDCSGGYLPEDDVDEENDIETSNRFDFEDQLMQCWNVTGDIDTIVAGSDHLDKDEVLAMLAGVNELNKIRFNRLMDLFDALVTDGKVL